MYDFCIDWLCNDLCVSLVLLSKGRLGSLERVKWALFNVAFFFLWLILYQLVLFILSNVCVIAVFSLWEIRLCLLGLHVHVRMVLCGKLVCTACVCWGGADWSGRGGRRRCSCLSTPLSLLLEEQSQGRSALFDGTCCTTHSMYLSVVDLCYSLVSTILSKCSCL